MVPKLEALGSGLQILQILQWSLHLQYCGVTDGCLDLHFGPASPGACWGLGASGAGAVHC